jgi:hypothetical protein
MDARQRWTLILTSVASLMVGLDLTVVTTALNTIRLDLGASIAELDWTINAYTLTGRHRRSAGSPSRGLRPRTRRPARAHTCACDEGNLRNLLVPRFHQAPLTRSR